MAIEHRISAQYVSFDNPQYLSRTQKQQAWDNIDISAAISKYVTLTSEEMYGYGNSTKAAADLPEVYFAINTDNNCIYTYNKRYAHKLLDKDGNDISLDAMKSAVAEKKAEFGADTAGNSDAQDMDFSTIAFKQIGRYKLYSSGTTINNWTMTGEGDSACMAKYENEELMLWMPAWTEKQESSTTTES